MASAVNRGSDQVLPVRQLAFSLPDTSAPEFEAEYRRQMARIAEHDRQTGSADRLDLDEDALRGWT